MSQQILGPNTLIQGALPDILANTPQSYFENTVKVIQVSMYCRCSVPVINRVTVLSHLLKST